MSTTNSTNILELKLGGATLQTFRRISNIAPMCDIYFTNYGCIYMQAMNDCLWIKISNLNDYVCNVEKIQILVDMRLLKHNLEMCADNSTILMYMKIDTDNKIFLKYTDKFGGQIDCELNCYDTKIDIPCYSTGSKTLKIKTNHTAVLAELFGLLSKSLYQFDLCFADNKLLLSELTTDRSVLFKLNLDGCNFECFRCDTELKLSIDATTLCKSLKIIDDMDNLSMCVFRSNNNFLYLNTTNQCGVKISMQISLMVPEYKKMPVPETEFQNKITMSADKFYNICKHLNNNSTFVEITSINDEILFRGQNEGGKVTMSYRDTNYRFDKINTQNTTNTQLYEIRPILDISRTYKLFSTVEIYLKDNFPLVTVVDVGTLGKMYVFISPIENPGH